MPDYEHKKIIETITRLDAPPSDAQAFAEWIKANARLAFLRDNADADEVVVYASGEYTFIHSLIVPNERLSTRTTSCPGIAMPTRRLRVTSPAADRKVYGWSVAFRAPARKRCKARCNWSLRGFEGWSGPGRNYLELHQEYAHVTGIHWRLEKRAYFLFRFPMNGRKVSIYTRESDRSPIKGSSIAKCLSSSLTLFLCGFSFRYFCAASRKVHMGRTP
jgi:hypothetical protein